MRWHGHAVDKNHGFFARSIDLRFESKFFFKKIEALYRRHFVEWKQIEKLKQSFLNLFLIYLATCVVI